MLRRALRVGATGLFADLGRGRRAGGQEGCSGGSTACSGVEATLTIHLRACPAGYEGPDYYGVCHDDPVAGLLFTLFGSGSIDEAETFTDGNAVFGNLRPGAYEVRGGTPEDVARGAVVCAPAAAPGTRFQSTRTDTAALAIDLAAGDDVVCDWYTVPWDRTADATPIAAPGQPDAAETTLTVYGALCPEGYPGSDYVAACSGTPAAGARFLIRKPDSWARLPAGGGWATADAGGAAWFALGDLAPGAVRLVNLIPENLPGGDGGFGVPRLSCTADDGRRVLYAMPLESRDVGPIFEIRVAAGDRVRCDAYFLPLPPQ